MAEASGGRTHRRQENLPPAGFEDRDDHRTACASPRIRARRKASPAAHAASKFPSSKIGLREAHNTGCHFPLAANT